MTNRPTQCWPKRVWKPVQRAMALTLDTYDVMCILHCAKCGERLDLRLGPEGVTATLECSCMERTWK